MEYRPSVTPHTTNAYSGAYVLLPNYDAIWQVIEAAVYTHHNCCLDLINFIIL